MAARINEARRENIALEQHVPTLLSAITTQNAAARELRRAEVRLAEEVAELRARLDERVAAVVQRSRTDLETLNRAVAEHQQVLADHSGVLGQLERRVEFVRRELMIEARYGAAAAGSQRDVEPEVLAPEKLAAPGPLRLNVGCGHLPLDGYVNVDSRPLDSVDVVADARRMPFDPDSVDELFSAHLLEHFPADELARVVLPHWFRLVRPGGTVRAVVPDSEKMLEEYTAGHVPFDELRQVTFGDQEYDGDFHFNMFSRASVGDLLGSAGFADVELVDSGRRNGLCFEMEIVARKPAALDSSRDADSRATANA